MKKKRLLLTLSIFCMLAMATIAFDTDIEAQKQAVPQFSANVTGDNEIPLLIDYDDLGAAGKNLSQSSA